MVTLFSQDFWLTKNSWATENKIYGKDFNVEWLINRKFSNAINQLIDVKNAINRLITKLIAYHNVLIYQ